MFGAFCRRWCGGPRLLLLIFLIAAGLGVNTSRAQDASPDDVARLLAGMQPSAGSVAASWTRDPSWQHHRAQFDRSWKELEARQLSRIRPWADAHLPDKRPNVFYMFSGPDVLYVNAFFPGAANYVLAGLEPPGNMPALTEPFRRALPGALGGLRGSLSTVMSYSFFRTKDMQTTLAGSALNGTLPPMLVFLARSGKTVHEVTPVEVQRDGTLARRGRELSRGAVPGVEIAFSALDADGQPGPQQTIHYFQADLSDGGVKSSGLIQFMRGLGRGNSLIKSASYLMHTGGFNTIRQFLLDNSDAIVQDDLGVPVHMFRPQDFELRPYGRYVGPVEEFPNSFQPRLAEVFRGSPPRIDFGIGYRWRPNKSHLLLAVRKSGAPERIVASTPRRTDIAQVSTPERVRAPARPKATKAEAPARMQWTWDQ